MAGQSASFDDTSFKKNHEHGGEKLSDEIAVMIDSLKPPPDQSKCCIYKVPDHIRQSNESEAYTPQVISIGPFHRNNNPKLKKMEDFKLRYLKSFTYQAETKLEDIVSTIKGAEESVRECYSDRETLPLDSDDFVKMILVDASFIIEYFWKNKSKSNWTEYDKEILEPWLYNRMQMDLILLENQLPFFIIDKIYDTAFPSRSKGGHSFIELCFCQFEYYNVQNFRHSESEQILHFTDLVRNFFLPPRERRPDAGRRSQNMKEMQSAARLARVGLKFKKRESGNNINWSPLDLKFENGVLEIPPFQLDGSTEIFSRNIVALEQYHYREHAYITDYYTQLSFLIKTVKDLDVLVREQIIVNWLDGVVATSMINKLSEKSSCSQINMRILETIDHLGIKFNYGDLAEDLNNFYHFPEATTVPGRYVQIMMAPLKDEYFYNPWRGTATIGGILLVLLTVIQTLCALISVKNWK